MFVLLILMEIQMSEINKFGETLLKMPEPALLTVMVLAAFALAAFTIYMVVNNVSRPRR
jgi:hypothetical protein